MTITVCIMSYKYGHLLAHAIESVLCQTRKPDRILVVDDAGNDFDLERFEELYPSVEFIRNKTNKGIVQNFQDTLMTVETDKVMFLGADNWLDSQALKVLSNLEADIAYGDIILWGEMVEKFVADNGLQVHGGGESECVWVTGRPHGSSLYDVKKAKEVGGYERNPNSQKSEEDSMLFNKMIKNGCVVSYLPWELLYYRRHKANFQ